MSEWDFNRRWRFVLWSMVGIALVLFFFGVWDQMRWRRRSGDGMIKWQRGEETRVDSNGDGRVDEVSVRLPGTNEFAVKRDTDGDGTLDLQYVLRDGIAVELKPISEPVPRQK